MKEQKREFEKCVQDFKRNKIEVVSKEIELKQVAFKEKVETLQKLKEAILQIRNQIKDENTRKEKEIIKLTLNKQQDQFLQDF